MTIARLHRSGVFDAVGLEGAGRDRRRRHVAKALGTLVAAVAVFSAGDAFAAEIFQPGNTGCDCGSTDPAAPCQGNSVDYLSSGYKIGFEFSCDGGACRCGTFADGWNYWVAPASDNGTVQITGMTPAATGADLTRRNGWTLDAGDTTNTHPWDGRMRAFNASLQPTPLNPSSTAPFAIDTSKLTSWGSDNKATTVVKSMGSAATSERAGTNEACQPSRACLEMIETLTVMQRPPADNGATILKPPYFNKWKPLYSTADIDMSILPAFDPVVRSGIPVDAGFDYAMRSLRSPTIDHHWGWPNVENGKPRQNYGITRSYSSNDIVYGAKIAPIILDSFLQLTIKGDANQRKQLAIRATTTGVEYYNIFKNGGGGGHPECGGWAPDGGYANGRMGPVVLAAKLLGEHGWTDDIRAIVGRNGPDDCFGETGQIQPPKGRGLNIALYGDVHSSYKWGRTGKLVADPDSMVDAGGDPTARCGAEYMACCTWGIWKAQATLIHSVPEVAADWPVPAYLQYVDRMMTQGPICDDPSPDGNSWPQNHGIAVTNRCEGGSQSGRVCRNNSDCPGSSCDFAPNNFGVYNSWFANNMWDEIRSCAPNCPGQTPLPAARPGTPDLLEVK